MHHYLYLIILASSIFVPFIFTFHKRLSFHHHFKSLAFGLILMLSIFIPWDIWFTENGIWGFNEYYISGIYLLNLPLEECLFFICIPFCCIFTYHVVWTLSNDKSFNPMKNVSFIFSIILFGCGIFWIDKLYTFYTFIGLSIMLLIAPFTVNMKIFFKAFVILLVPFFIVNGLLTGSFIENQVGKRRTQKNVKLWQILSVDPAVNERGVENLIIVITAARWRFTKLQFR